MSQNLNKDFDDRALRVPQAPHADYLNSFRIEQDIEVQKNEEKIVIDEIDNELSMTFYGQSQSKSDLPNSIKNIIIDDNNNNTFNQNNSMPLGINEIKMSNSKVSGDQPKVQTYIMRNIDFQLNDSLHSIEQPNEKHLRDHKHTMGSPRNINIKFNNDENIKKQQTNVIGIPKIMKGNNGILLKSPLDFDLEEIYEFQSNSSMNSTARFGNQKFDSHIKNFNSNKFSQQNSSKSPLRRDLDKQVENFEEQITGKQLEISKNPYNIQQKPTIGPVFLQNLHTDEVPQETLPDIRTFNQTIFKDFQQAMSPRQGSPPGSAGRIKVLPIPLGQKGELIDFSTMQRSISPQNRMQLNNDLNSGYRVTSQNQFNSKLN